jgi:integrase
MPRRKAIEPPPGSRYTSAGRITITIPCVVKGEATRLSQNKILPSEPRSYATAEEAHEGYQRVLAYLEQRVDRDQTVRGFWERWLDHDDARWGLLAKPKRGIDTRIIYESRTTAFVKMFEDRPMASLTDADVLAYQRSPHYAASQMVVISTFLRDAAQDKLRIGNPAKQIAKEAGDALRWRREQHRPKAPSLAQIEQALRHMKLHLDVYPRSLYGWFLTGARTGMRGGELDGMCFEYVDGDQYAVRYQLHYRTNELCLPKWVHVERDCRKVYLPADVLAEIREQRRERMANDWQEPYIWLNTEGGPWRHDARDKWWAKQVAGTSLRQICGDVPIYNATRHHWASHAVNVAGMSPYDASRLFGHKDGGKLIIERYVTHDADAAVDAARRVYASLPAVQELRS